MSQSHLKENSSELHVAGSEKNPPTKLHSLKACLGGSGVSQTNQTKSTPTSLAGASHVDFPLDWPPSLLRTSFLSLGGCPVHGEVVALPARHQTRPFKRTSFVDPFCFKRKTLLKTYEKKTAVSKNFLPCHTLKTKFCFGGLSTQNNALHPWSIEL